MSRIKPRDNAERLLGGAAPLGAIVFQILPFVRREIDERWTFSRPGAVPHPFGQTGADRRGLEGEADEVGREARQDQQQGAESLQPAIERAAGFLRGFGFADAGSQIDEKTLDVREAEQGRADAEQDRREQPQELHDENKGDDLDDEPRRERHGGEF